MKKTTNKWLYAGLVSGLCTLTLSCSSDSNPVVTGSTTDANMSLSFTALDALGEDYVYEGWLLVNGEALSTGRFSSVTSITQLTSVENAMAATKFILTIEPTTDDDPAPANTHVLAGDIVDNAATLTIANSDALGTDFMDSTGSFILETPSSEPAEDFAQGIWWLTPGAEGASAGLALPTLPAGWAYEGWVVEAGAPVSTGRFTDVAAADSDGAGPTAGPNATPAFPGQDFITPPLVLTDMTAVISVEPEPDNSPAPFGLKPLIDTIIENVGAGVSQDMANAIADNQPAGTLSIQLPAAPAG